MKEREIRPHDMFNRYLELARHDAEKFLSDNSQFVEVNCPACRNDRSEFAFEKLGFEYRTCPSCSSLFASPRPTPEMLDRYYREGDAVKFWTGEFYRTTEDARRASIYTPRALLLKELLARNATCGSDVLADVGAGVGIFLEEVEKLELFQRVVGIDPAPHMAEACRARGLSIIQKPVELTSRNEIHADVVTSFELLEHVFSPEVFLCALCDILKTGGLCIVTTLTISGLDLQVLWNHSKSIYPPHHLNFLSIEGLTILLKDTGFEPLEIETPGELDIDIILNAVEENPEIELPRFLQYVLTQRGSRTHDALQSFLRRNNLSSHVRCIVRKTRE